MTIASRFARHVGYLILASVLAVACSPNDDPVDGPTNRSKEIPMSPELINRATDFGGLTLTDNVKVLQVHEERGLDITFRLAMETDPEGLSSLLTTAHFTAQLSKVYPPFPDTLAGPKLTDSPAVLMAQDRYRQPTGRHIYRTVLVDERNSTTRFVHIDLFTT